MQRLPLVSKRGSLRAGQWLAPVARSTGAGSERRIKSSTQKSIDDANVMLLLVNGRCDAFASHSSHQFRAMLERHLNHSPELIYNVNAVFYVAFFVYVCELRVS